MDGGVSRYRFAKKFGLSRSTLLYYDAIGLARPSALDKQSRVNILRATGLGDDQMQRWHVEFERMASESHQDFLESLGLSVEDIARIRGYAKAQADQLRSNTQE